MNLRQKYKRAKKRLEQLEPKTKCITLRAEERKIETLCAQLILYPPEAMDTKYVERRLSSMLASSIVRHMKLERRIDSGSGEFIFLGSVKVVKDDNWKDGFVIGEEEEIR